MKGKTVQVLYMKQLKVHKDERGELWVQDGLPFEPKRIFYVTGIPEEDQERGGHAHKECAQLLICQQGSVEVSASNGAPQSELPGRTQCCGR